LASWIPRIRGNPMSEKVGDYAILIFCISVGSLVDLNGIFSKMSETLAFATVLLFSSIVLHFLFCWIARIDVDTTIITSTACIFSPAFVCPIAEKIGNKKVILTGLTTGVVGLAIGNSMGILLSMLGQWLVTL
ncbi:MAG: hypothetical protein NZ108_07435, partial [Bacteroidia bacterium]|nr:hypothetical protein [Bacteroidia bacterium]